MSALHDSLAEYLAVRRALGYRLEGTEMDLPRFRGVRLLLSSWLCAAGGRSYRCQERIVCPIGPAPQVTEMIGGRGPALAGCASRSAIRAW
jgi:hypothetical protein